jgi:hypothetical protein
MKHCKFRIKSQVALSLAIALIFGALALFSVAATPVAKAVAETGNTPATVLTDTLPSTNTISSTVFLPSIMDEYTQLAMRIGYGATNYPITRFPDIRSLNAGWYLDWSVNPAPVRPSGMEYAQLINVHQKLACGDVINGDRIACPYAQPLDYIYRPDQATIEAAARANLGNLWFIGNEMDRIDWFICDEFDAQGNCLPGKIRSAGQNEMLPETYAQAYHDLYTIIKTADPTARVGIGGVIQATPLRLQYLTIVWNTYKNLFGQDMPVDVWNVHNFILREEKNVYGAEIPPGLPGNPTIGSYIGNDCTHTDAATFDKQIRDFRQWMKDRGQQEKPLMVNEYGVLYAHIPLAPNDNNGNCKINFGDETVVDNFMLWSFDYFLNTKDCTLGYSADDCRLTQRWLWFALDSTYLNADGQLISGLNKYASLFNGTTLGVTKAGELFRQFVQSNLSELAR